MAVFDLPTLLARRALAIYKNGLKLIVPDTASTPAGKLAHGEAFADDVVDSSINRVTDNHRLNMRRWTANTPTYGVNTKTYDDLETSELNDIIWQNRSGGTLTSASVPGVVPITQWFPLTNGGTPTFNIPFWNNTGVVMLAGGAPVTTGTVAYAHQVIVRAENGLYQRNDITNPPPVSTNFLDEMNDTPSKWFFLGEFTFLTRAEFAFRVSNSTLVPNRSYFLTDVNVFLQATNFNNYSRDGSLLVAYGGAPQRGTTEIEKVKYDAVANVFLERIDNWGNYVIQTSGAVNSGGAANCITNAPWGHLEFENNYIENVRWSNSWTLSKINTFRNNDIRNLLHNNTDPTTTIRFENNIGNTGTFNTAAATSVFTECLAINRGTVTASGDLTGAKATMPGSTASAAYAQANALNGTASGGHTRLSGNGGTVSGSNSFGHGETPSITGPNSAGFGSSPSITGDGSFRAGNSGSIAGDHAQGFGYSPEINGDYSSGSGRGPKVDNNNFHAIGWARPGDTVNTYSTHNMNSTQSLKFTCPLGRGTDSATVVTLVPVNVDGGALAIPSLHHWLFEMLLIGYDNAGADAQTWIANGHCWNNLGTVTYIQDVLFLQNAGTWTNVVSSVRTTVGSSIGTIAFSGAAGAMQINITPAVAPVNWMGELRVIQVG